MFNIKRRKVKAVYHNAFCCPECGLELHRDRNVLTTYPAQYCYFCDCGFRTTSSQLPGYEVEFEDEEEDLPPAYPERIIDAFCEIPLSQQLKLSDFTLSDFTTLCTADAVANIKAVQDAFADSMGYAYV